MQRFRLCQSVGSGSILFCKMLYFRLEGPEGTEEPLNPSNWLKDRQNKDI